MANEKRLIDAIKHRLECHIANVIHKGIDNIPMGKDSSSATEFLRGYERGAIETANIALGMIPNDAVEVVHGRWILEQEYGNGTADYKCSVCDYDDTFPIGNFTYGKYCPNCGAKMDGGNEDG